MLNSEINLIKSLAEKEASVSQLAKSLGLSVSYVSELVSKLERENLVEKGKKVRLAKSAKARALLSLMAKYSPEKLLSGSNDEVAVQLLSPKTAQEIMKATGLEKTAVYSALQELQETGAVGKKGGKYLLSDEPLFGKYILLLGEEKALQNLEEYAMPVHSNGDRLKKVPRGKKAAGYLTAFSRFPDYGIPLSTVYDFYSDKEPPIEAVLIHALICSESKTERSLCALFFLKNQNRLDLRKAYDEVLKTGLGNGFADMLSYIRDHDSRGKFLPWGEFLEKAELYGVNIPVYYSGEETAKLLERIGGALEKPLTAYLIGGQNMILRGLKTSTKDIDVVVSTGADFDALAKALKKLGFAKTTRFSPAYRNMHPNAIFEKNGEPRIDMFTRSICKAMVLTDGMKSKSEAMNYGKLAINLVSLEDIFLFKSITDREGDLEDAAAIVRRTKLDWGIVFSEMLRQEKETGKLFSVSVLDTVETLEGRLGMKIPLKRRLVSHCLEGMLLFALDEPKTVRELQGLVDFPSHRIRGALKKLEKSGRIKKAGNKFVGKR